jgi:hypothetical protein
MDLNTFNDFIQFRRDSNYDVILANTINNGVAAFYQQEILNLIPKDILSLEFPDGGLKGTLWESGEKANILHNYFINNYEKFIYGNENFHYQLIDSRFSINFFAFKGSEWYKIKDCGDINIGDEENLTVTYVKDDRKFKNIMYYPFYVSHLSFYQQETTGIDVLKILDSYNKLADIILVN